MPRSRLRSALVVATTVLPRTARGSGTTNSGSEIHQALPGYPVTVEDCGRALTFTEPPSRAVLSYQPIAEMFVGLGLADRAGFLFRTFPDMAAGRDRHLAAIIHELTTPGWRALHPEVFAADASSKAAE